MSLKGSIERRLSAVSDFADPDPDLEQYRTPASVAAHLVALADIQEDLAGAVVLDLGTGTGMLALGAALRNPRRVLGVEVDGIALEDARRNEAAVEPGTPVDWIRADVRSLPLRPPRCTVLANPPFGAHADNIHADREFLGTIAEVADVSYTIHNEGSREFVEAFSMDHGGTITHAYAVEFALPRQFMHHEADSRTIQAELYRIAWTGEPEDSA
jgi:putative methylase